MPKAMWSRLNYWQCTVMSHLFTNSGEITACARFIPRKTSMILKTRRWGAMDDKHRSLPSFLVPYLHLISVEMLYRKKTRREDIKENWKFDSVKVKAALVELSWTSLCWGLSHEERLLQLGGHSSNCHRKIAWKCFKLKVPIKKHIFSPTPQQRTY